MDFSKAFDKVAHNRFLLKLSHYGIRGYTYNWISSFLKDRHQRVVIDGSHSEWVHIDSGVPEGTVLGPLLFLLFINDLPNKITSTVRLFADDCVLYRSVEKPVDSEKLQQDLDTLCEWEKTWQMEFNADKCYVMKLTHSKNPSTYDYKLGTTSLQETTNHTYLGVDITNDLRWNQHVNKITSSANRSLGFLRHNISACSRKTKVKAYATFVRPHLEYSSAVWDSYTQDQISQIEPVQRRGARFVYNDYNYQSSPSAMLASLEWDLLALRRKEHRLNVLQNAMHGHISIPVRNILPPTTRLSRSANSTTFHRLQARKDCYKFSFFPRTIVDWNRLPIDIISITDKQVFKQELHKHLRN